MSDVNKALRVHTTLVKAGVDPEYAEAETLKATERLAETEPAELAAALLSATPPRFLSTADPHARMMDRLTEAKRQSGAYAL
jgi:hypothetical protein